MQLTADVMVGRVLAVMTHIASIEPRKRTEKERYWMTRCETMLLKLYTSVPPHLQDMQAKIDVTLGRLVEAGPETRGDAPKED